MIRRELEVDQELLGVRKAVAVQKIVTDDLIKASAVTHIDCLPNELLVQIILLIKYERESLASVSCSWRAVVIDTPSI